MQALELIWLSDFDSMVCWETTPSQTSAVLSERPLDCQHPYAWREISSIHLVCHLQLIPDSATFQDLIFD
jgi:hypothetical protein